MLALLLAQGTAAAVPESIAVVNGVLPTSGTVDLTSTGFGTPEGVILFVSGALLDATITAHAVLGIGAMDSTTQGSVAFTAQDAVATSNTNRSLYTALSAAPLATGTAALDWDINGTLITDGVQLSIINAPAGANRITALLLGNLGIGIVEVIIQDDLGASATDIPITLSKFGAGAPDCVFMATQNSSTAPDTIAGNGVVSYGFSDFTNHGSVSFGGPDADAGPEYMTAMVSDSFALTQTFNGAVAWNAYPHTPTTTNFQMNLDASAGNDIALIVAIGLNSGYDVSVDPVSVPTGADMTISTSVTPDSNLIITCEGPTVQDTLVSTVDVAPGIVSYDGFNISAISLGVTDLTAQNAVSQHSDSLDLVDGAGTASAVVGIPSFSGQDVIWTTSTRPAAAILGASLSIGASVAASPSGSGLQLISDPVSNVISSVISSPVN